MTENIFLWILGILSTIIMGLVRHIIITQDKVKLDLMSEQLNVQEEMTEIKENYLDRFAKIYKLQNETKEELKTAINQLSVAVAQIDTKLQKP